MRLVHLSDLHLGYRQYQRLTPGGINQREADVAATFRAAIDKIIALGPDLVLIAGDVFHTVRPTNQAILHAFMQFSRLARSLPGAKIVMVAGNHDTPRSSETGGILRLFEQIGITVVDTEARILEFPDLELSILAVPDVPTTTAPRLRLSGGSRFNVMIAHGEVQGMVAGHFVADRAALVISRDDLSAGRWDYVALGHYHVYTEVASNAFFSGSIDYTSADTWGELYEERQARISGKGFIEHDLLTGDHIFHALSPARPLIDLPPIRVARATPATVDAQIRDAVASVPGGIDDKIVRLLVRDITRSVARELDHKAIREYKRRALSFNLDLRAPDMISREATSGAPSRRPSLSEMVKEKLMTRPLDADIDRTALVGRGLAYLDEAQLVALPPSAILES
ncbi:MAG TPA: DNA repair exonuclease [Gemmatimonadaceae bacterium]|nr:DNA repair exonuclease [Gemmatimonadaceae bacterium]